MNIKPKRAMEVLFSDVSIGGEFFDHDSGDDWIKVSATGARLSSLCGHTMTGTYTFDPSEVVQIEV